MLNRLLDGFKSFQRREVRILELPDERNTAT